MQGELVNEQLLVHSVWEVVNLKFRKIPFYGIFGVNCILAMLTTHIFTVNCVLIVQGDDLDLGVGKTGGTELFY